MAIALATARFLRKHPDGRFSSVAVEGVESDFALDPAEDAIDYWSIA